MTDYILVGGGGLAREVLDWFAPTLEGSGSGFVGYIDDGDDPMAAFGLGVFAPAHAATAA